MGYGYDVFPLSQVLHWSQVRTHLEEIDTVFPTNVVKGRYPTFSEILTVANSISGYIVRGNSDIQDWQISIYEDKPPEEEFFTGRSVILEVWSYGRNITEDFGFWVYRGDEEAIVLVISQLARICGPFFVEDELGESCIVVFADTAPDTKWTILDWAEEEDDEAEEDST